MSNDQSETYDKLKTYLKHCQSKIFLEIQNFVPKKEPKLYLYDLIQEYPKRGGKGFRPGLCLLANKLFGGDNQKALNTATAIELFHNAFLIHDDVEDNSILRRGKQTLNHQYGKSIAVNVGDAMNLLSFNLLTRNYEILGYNLANQVFKEIEFMITQTLEGQALELGWIYEDNYGISEDQYLKMVLKKTCWYTTIQPLRLGIMLSDNSDSKQLNKYNYLGYYMGASFQIQDDILNIIGDELKYGKEKGGDIVEGKRTLMTINLLKKCSDKEGKDIRHILNNTKNEESDINFVIDLMHKHGSIDYANKCALNLAGAAISEFETLFTNFSNSEEKLLLENLLHYMVKRNL